MGCKNSTIKNASEPNNPVSAVEESKPQFKYNIKEYKNNSNNSNTFRRDEINVNYYQPLPSRQFITDRRASYDKRTVPRDSLVKIDSFIHRGSSFPVGAGENYKNANELRNIKNSELYNYTVNNYKENDYSAPTKDYGKQSKPEPLQPTQLLSPQPAFPREHGTKYGEVEGLQHPKSLPPEQADSPSIPTRYNGPSHNVNSNLFPDEVKGGLGRVEKDREVEKPSYLYDKNYSWPQPGETIASSKSSKSPIRSQSDSLRPSFLLKFNKNADGFEEDLPPTSPKKPIKSSFLPSRKMSTLDLSNYIRTFLCSPNPTVMNELCDNHGDDSKLFELLKEINEDIHCVESKNGVKQLSADFVLRHIHAKLREKGINDEIRLKEVQSITFSIKRNSLLGGIPDLSEGQQWKYLYFVRIEGPEGIYVTATDTTVNKIVDIVSKIDVIGISFNVWIKDGTLPKLIKIIELCPNIQILDLGSNYIGPENAASISQVLTKCNKLRKLDLKDNNMGPVVAKAVIASLPKCSNLSVLDLWWNNIETEGAEALAKVLPKCHRLYSLNLSRNNIKSLGAVAIALVLPLCPQLTTLNIRDNNIGTEGGKALAEALEKCPYLTTLSIGDNKAALIGDEVFNKINAIMDERDSDPIYIEFDEENIPDFIF